MPGASSTPEDPLSGEAWWPEAVPFIPECDYEPPEPIGELLGPDGELLTYVFAPRPPFGFHRTADSDK